MNTTTAGAASEPAKVWHPMDGDAFGGLDESGEPVLPAQVKRAHDVAEGLRGLAGMVERHPELVGRMGTALDSIGTHVFPSENPKAVFAEFARAALASGAAVTKPHSERYGKVQASWGPVSFSMQTERDQVCERVVTGTEMVTKTVKDPAALAAVPEVEVTEEVETVEWRCTPLLADESAVTS